MTKTNTPVATMTREQGYALQSAFHNALLAAGGSVDGYETCTAGSNLPEALRYARAQARAAGLTLAAPRRSKAGAADFARAILAAGRAVGMNADTGNPFSAECQCERCLRAR